MNIKKITKRAVPWFLMIGACITIGLLSFGGMLALWPSVAVATVSLILTVAYEGHIYLESTQKALKKLFKAIFFERELGKQCLLKHFPLAEIENASELNGVECPTFFKDYWKQLHLLHRFEGKRLDKESELRKKHVQKTLTDMEKWFAVQLFSTDPGKTKYQQELHAWLALKPENGRSILEQYTAKRDSNYVLFKYIGAFCLLAGALTGIGTSYLLIDVFATIPLLAVIPLALLPWVIVPLSLIAGVAYGLLVYNAATDMITNEMVLKWYDKINKYRQEKRPVVNAIRVVGIVAILALNIILAICTAGTWWTVVKTTPPLFKWMSKLPAFIMFDMNPLISAVSMFIFNVENVNETFDQLEKAINPEETLAKEAVNSKPVVKIKIDEENKWQKWNPFRLFIVFTFEPLRFLLFVGHIASISAAGDRVPGVKAWVSAIFCGINEFLEDLHWFNLIAVFKKFFGGAQAKTDKHDTKTLLDERLSGGDEHNHDTDLPTKMLTFLYMPFYLLAASWDTICSRGNSGNLKPVDFWAALDKEMGLPKVEKVEFNDRDCCFTDTNDATPSSPITHTANFFNPDKIDKKRNVLPNPSAWTAEHAAYRIERHKEKCLQEVWFGRDMAQQQMAKLNSVQNKLYIKSDETQFGLAPAVETLINEQEVNDPIYNQHSFFFYAPTGETHTRKFLDNLPARVALVGG